MDSGYIEEIGLMLLYTKFHIYVFPFEIKIADYFFLHISDPFVVIR